MTNTFPIALAGAVAPTLMWANPDEVEPAALDQLRNIAALPWVEGLRVMPDVHLGKGATVGSVVAMRDAVAPSAVGVDIGCGMAAVRSNLTAEDLPDDLRAMRTSIEAAVPVGFAGHESGLAENLVPHRAPLGVQFDALMRRFEGLHSEVYSEKGRMQSQCGTLGGGNHFVEVCTSEDGAVWLMLHSGSRGIGNRIAQWHIDRAKGMLHNADLPDKDLAVFLAGTPGMTEYLHDLYWAQDYALLNRRVMLDLVMGAVRKHLPKIKFEDPITCHHNYVAEETYDGVDLIVTRKGAIRAGAGQWGLIPGSMGTGSYVVKGLGNELSYQSASHGAGRRMSRNAAKRQFTAADLAEQTAGVECRKDEGVVDEIPAAYKDLRAVIEAQTTGPEPLVETYARLTTLLCVKG